MDTQGNRRRRQPRAALQLTCTLTRRKGGPIDGRTLDLGPGGMRVTTNRPLAIDEVLHFHLPFEEERLDGDARVVREHGPNVYALRFEGLAPEAATRLEAVVPQG
jgi:PilZ domain